MNFKTINNMTITSDHKEAILKHLTSGKTLNSADALALYDCKSLSQRIYDLKKDGHVISDKQVNGSKSYYIKKTDIQRRPKMVQVTETVHLEVKGLAFKSAVAGKKMTEGEIYVEAINIGLEALKKKIK